MESISSLFVFILANFVCTTFLMTRDCYIVFKVKYIQLSSRNGVVSEQLLTLYIVLLLYNCIARIRINIVDCVCYCM